MISFDTTVDVTASLKVHLDYPRGIHQPPMTDVRDVTPEDLRAANLVDVDELLYILAAGVQDLTAPDEGYPIDDEGFPLFGDTLAGLVFGYVKAMAGPDPVRDLAHLNVKALGSALSAPIRVEAQHG